MSRKAALLVVTTLSAATLGARIAPPIAIDNVAPGGGIRLMLADRPSVEAHDRDVFLGVVLVINGDVWDIDGHPVVVDDRTRVINDPAPGDHVQVIAKRTADGTLALEIETVF